MSEVDRIQALELYSLFRCILDRSTKKSKASLGSRLLHRSYMHSLLAYTSNKEEKIHQHATIFFPLKL